MEKQHLIKDGDRILLTPAEETFFTPQRVKRMIDLINFKSGN